MDDLAEKSLSAMRGADRLHVNLEGPVNPPGDIGTVAANGSRGIAVQDVLPDGRLSGNITDGEIWKIETVPELQSRTTYYFNGRPWP